MDSNFLAKQIETYSNAIVAFHVIQGLAYLYYFGTNQTFNCLVKNKCLSRGRSDNNFYSSHGFICNRDPISWPVPRICFERVQRNRTQNLFGKVDHYFDFFSLTDINNSWVRGLGQSRYNGRMSNESQGKR